LPQSYANSLAIPAPISILLSTSAVSSGENHMRRGDGNCPEYESYGNNSSEKNNFYNKNYLFHYSRNSFYNKNYNNNYNNNKATLTTVGTIKISQQQSPKQQMPQSKHTPQQQSQKQQMSQEK
jgi:hypothetical protein